MHTPKRRRLTGLKRAALALLFSGGTAHAGEFHFEGFRYGQTAMGMGGAMVGQPFEPEATYYNPAGLAMIRRGVRFSGALNFFGYDRRVQQGALRDGGLFAPRDLDSSSFLPTPSSSVISTRRGRHAVAFSTFLAGDLDERFSGAQEVQVVDDPDFESARFTRSFTRKDTLQLRGLTYAYSPGPTLSFGISLFWLQHDRSEIARRAQIAGALTAPTNLFIDVTTSEETRTHSLVPRLGVSWLPTPDVGLGLSCQLLTIPLTGKSTYGYTLITSGELAQEVEPLYRSEQETSDARTKLPMSCRAGVATGLTRRWRMAGDLSVHLPTQYDRFDVPKELAARPDIAGRVDTDLTVNLSLGVQRLIGRRWPWRMGLFTNRTSAVDIPRAPTRFLPAHLDLYGVTTSLGYLGDTRSLNLGIEVQYGAGHDVVSDSLGSLLDEAGFTRVQREEWRVVIFIAGAAAFAKATAKGLVRDMERKPEPKAAPTPAE